MIFVVSFAYCFVYPVVLYHEQRKVSAISHEKQHMACVVLIALNSTRLSFYLILRWRITRSDSLTSHCRFRILSSNISVVQQDTQCGLNE